MQTFISFSLLSFFVLSQFLSFSAYLPDEKDGIITEKETCSLQLQDKKPSPFNSSPFYSFKNTNEENVFISAGFASFIGRWDGMLTYTFHLSYNQDIFSLNAKSFFGIPFFDTKQSNDPEFEDVYLPFNVTDISFAYYFYEYRNNKTYRAFTGKSSWRGDRRVVYYKKAKTKRDNRIGVRFGYFHDQEDLVDDLTFGMETIEDIRLTSYSANSFFVGVVKNSRANARYNQNKYLHHTNLYADFMIPFYTYENYMQYQDPSNYTFYYDLDHYSPRVGWRIGYEKFGRNTWIPHTNSTAGVEFGCMPVPKYVAQAGYYILFKLGLAFSFEG